MKPIWLRLVAGLLLLANLLYFTWTEGGLAWLGTEPARTHESEPQRMSQQIRPTILQIGKE